MRFQTPKPKLQEYKSTIASLEETKRVAGINVTLSWPSKDESSSPRGVTFLLTGAMISLSEYKGLRDVILEQQHLVVGLYVNVLWPLRNNHRKHAQDVKNVFDALESMYDYLPPSYKVVGHSAGGKIALLLPSIIDPKRVSAVLALDPVDLNPVEFSNKEGKNLPLDEEQKVSEEGRETKRIPIMLTCTDGGLKIPQNHTAEAIHKFHPTTMFYRHAHAGHLAYCDNGGGFASYLMPDVGTKEGNEQARKAAHDLIRQILGS
mmetsp:Transcript_28216/g.47958  ORF Transcript_28216/g.47958 Transcript_28216/m.47958 type:complete len:262 (-) Transcript_28216:1533-2318(-)